MWCDRASGTRNEAKEGHAAHLRCRWKMPEALAIRFQKCTGYDQSCGAFAGGCDQSEGVLALSDQWRRLILHERVVILWSQCSMGVCISCVLAALLDDRNNLLLS